MDPDLKDLLSAFNTHAVRYVIVGSYALAVHAQPRATGDLDLFIATDPANAAAAYSALSQFGAPLHGVTPQDFEDPDSIFQIGVSPIRIDILKRISGLDFETVWQSAMPWLIDGDVPSRYISEDHFITNKLATGRLQDLADVAAVRQAQRAKYKSEN